MFFLLLLWFQIVNVDQICYGQNWSHYTQNKKIWTLTLSVKGSSLNDILSVCGSYSGSAEEVKIAKYSCWSKI